MSDQALVSAVGKALDELFHENITKSTDNQIGEGDIDVFSPNRCRKPAGQLKSP
jgi:hypothetical protein